MLTIILTTATAGLLLGGGLGLALGVTAGAHRMDDLTARLADARRTAATWQEVAEAYAADRDVVDDALAARRAAA